MSFNQVEIQRFRCLLINILLLFRLVAELLSLNRQNLEMKHLDGYRLEIFSIKWLLCLASEHLQ